MTLVFDPGFNLTIKEVREIEWADSRGHRNDLVSRQRFVAPTKEAADGSTSHDP